MPPPSCNKAPYVYLQQLPCSSRHCSGNTRNNRPRVIGSPISQLSFVRFLVDTYCDLDQGISASSDENLHLLCSSVCSSLCSQTHSYQLMLFKSLIAYPLW
ncbi:hypothetical protein WMY93_003946 [Mugilogobius chulae]|uniref:Uncharacterized protein n=1 Tax=Mugilogobius chulae TaxID=88201 RepID=A0AAW0Q282_9GOBI